MNTDIDKLDAGRELDAAVWAALGYEVKLRDCWYEQDCEEWLANDGFHKYRHRTDDVQHPCYFVEPNPDDPEFTSDGYWEVVPFVSTEIAAAWTVVEKMIADDRHWYHLETLGPFVDGTPRHWRCILSYRLPTETRLHPMHHVWIEGDTAPLAICRAALYSREVDGD